MTRQEREILARVKNTAKNRLLSEVRLIDFSIFREGLRNENLSEDEIELIEMDFLEMQGKVLRMVMKF